MVNSLVARVTEVVNYFSRYLAVFLAFSLIIATVFTPTLAAMPNSLSVHHKTQPLRIAVASNFLPILKQLTSRFEQQNKIEVQLVAAASGVLYQQIRHGAPFDLFLSADSEKPRLLEQASLISLVDLAYWQSLTSFQNNSD